MLDRTVAYGLDFLFPAADTVVGACLRRHGEFARAELDFLVEMGTQSGVFLDVGANIGAIALPFARQRPTWRVMALEASRTIHGLLCANALGNRLFNVEAHHAAAAAEQGFLEFPAVPLSSAINFGAVAIGDQARVTETVRTVALDDFAPPETRLIKLDVEGYEPEVLKGSVRLLREQRAIWFSEVIIQQGEATSGLIRTFLDAGYRVHWFYAPFATMAAPKDRPAESGWGDTNIVALPPSVANSWNLPEITDPSDVRPSKTKDYAYLRRYGFD